MPENSVQSSRQATGDVSPEGSEGTFKLVEHYRYSRWLVDTRTRDWTVVFSEEQVEFACPEADRRFTIQRPLVCRFAYIHGPAEDKLRIDGEHNLVFEIGEEAKATFVAWRGPLGMEDLRRALKPKTHIGLGIGLILLSLLAPIAAPGEAAESVMFSLDPKLFVAGIAFASAGVGMLRGPSPTFFLLDAIGATIAICMLVVHLFTPDGGSFSLLLLVGIVACAWGARGSWRLYRRFASVRE